MSFSPMSSEVGNRLPASVNTAPCSSPKIGNVYSTLKTVKNSPISEVERAEIFELVRVRIHTVVEANRADRQLVTKTTTNGVAHVVQPNVLGGRQQIASVSKHGALQFAENWECVFNIENGKKLSDL